MTENSPNPRLYLLVPWDLPIQAQLDEADKKKLCKALNQLLQAFKQTSHQEALALIKKGLAELGIEDALTAKVPSTKTFLKVWEVEDFDNYFDVLHVQTKEPAVYLARSVLMAYQTFLELNQYQCQLDPVQVELYQRGFERYVYLLVRVFDLCLEEN